MMEYIVKFELLNPRNNVVYKCETRRSNVRNEVIEEYEEKGMAYTTMGFLEIVVAEVYEYHMTSDVIVSITTIVDWRKVLGEE